MADHECGQTTDAVYRNLYLREKETRRRSLLGALASEHATSRFFTKVSVVEQPRAVSSYHYAEPSLTPRVVLLRRPDPRSPCDTILRIRIRPPLYATPISSPTHTTEPLQPAPDRST